MNPAENYIFSQPEPYRSILMHLQLVIEKTLPEVSLKYKWNIPCFYVDKSPICYLNASHKKQFVDIAFWNSAHLTKHLDKMVSEKRKVVRSLRYASLEEIDDKVLTEVLEDAYSVRKNGFYKR
ncbi:DUF1801 domain-containing protein [Maribacter cobaltidurans]|uniref:2-dehydro-3-deoxyphosphooctonate aldolase n=1 Tax=Maribacter cobaltidurans TaxID=1178778 RepID=A0A223V1Q6_9FLAO|nr:DUF1801 domain-containing protein [Maribacter cobaltidurans]ASV29281.1 2-dehydro-3-deoxyphosphooctonate aldolase [Maribacter cobaltidurans]GGD70378.1 hypothetical protein GCM10011412_04940 [Maribacter cobaltidurans]